MTDRRIDAHQHFWRLDRGDYGWLTPDLAPLYRDFGPVDLAPLLAETGIAATILVQAAPTEAETRFLLDTARDNPLVSGVVGWIDMAASDAASRIAALAADARLRGIRPMIHDIADPHWIIDSGLTAAFDAIEESELAFDFLVRPLHLANVLNLLRRRPRLRAVIDHGAKPDIRRWRVNDADFCAWARHLAAIARETSAFCKLSGLVTEAAATWQIGDLRPYVDVLAQTFGPARLMWGSDWPVVNLAGGYRRWHETALECLIGYAPTELANMMGGTATQFYRA
ncbi:MAG: amidohydrolase [Alphaproteobacteria bacterium]|nr:amidohydrolase [Alphaproteobacteria bacterium]